VERGKEGGREEGQDLPDAGGELVVDEGGGEVVKGPKGVTDQAAEGGGGGGGVGGGGGGRGGGGGGWVGGGLSVFLFLYFFFFFRGGGRGLRDENEKSLWVRTIKKKLSFEPSLLLFPPSRPSLPPSLPPYLDHLRLDRQHHLFPKARAAHGRQGGDTTRRNIVSFLRRREGGREGGRVKMSISECLWGGRERAREGGREG